VHGKDGAEQDRSETQGHHAAVEADISAGITR
jgi:hypothetical protein